MTTHIISQKYGSSGEIGQEEAADDEDTVVTHSTDQKYGSDSIESREDHGDERGAQMRVIRHVETTYVGGLPVKQSSNIELRDDDEDEELEQQQLEQQQGVAEERVAAGRGKKVVITETRIEKMASDGDEKPRSIMKKHGEKIKKASMKKEISFSDDVVGG